MFREFIDQLDKLPQKTLASSLSIDMSRPLIGIISAQNGVTASDSALDALCESIKEGIVSAGGTAKVAHVPCIDDTALCGTVSSKYDLPSRDLTADAVEMLCSHEFFDGLVFAASEPNTVCGMLLGAIRMNIPCAFVCQGTMMPMHDGDKEHGFVYLYEQISRIKTGKTSYESIENSEKDLPLVLGTDCSRYGANSFNCILEAAGLAVRGNGTAPAGSPERTRIARDAGELAVRLSRDKWTPKRALSRAALTDMLTLDLACGGSSTTLLNLIAVARELGVKNFHFKYIGEVAANTPLLLTRHYENKCLMTQFHQAGGVYAMLKRLLDGGRLEETYLSDGETIAERLSNVRIADDKVIRAISKGVPGSRLRTVYGNVTEGGALLHCGGKATSFTGTAKVYANEEMAVEALLHREIKAGDVVVIQGEGPRSGPGMREIFASLALLKGYDLEDKVAVITDGRFADFYNGFVVGHVTPETGEQNLFSVLQDGDEIEISLTKGKVSLDIKAKDLNMRYRQHDSAVGNYGNPLLRKWSRTCGTAVEGCAYKPVK